MAEAWPVQLMGAENSMWLMAVMLGEARLTGRVATAVIGIVLMGGCNTH